MGDQLKADIGRIREAGESVARISQAFSDTKDMVNGHRDAIGNDHLSDELEEFATNWKIHRKRMQEDLDTFSGWAIQCADGYEDTDKGLKKALEEGAEG